MKPFENFDFSKFWEQSDYATEAYVDEPLTPELLASIEAELGYKLPAAYVALAMNQNGGLPLNECHRVATPTSYSADHIAVHGIFAIGSNKSNSLCGDSGSKFWVEGWEYPDIGVYFADCPSAGHDMLCLDYSECGPTGEPRVVHVDQDFDYDITVVAPNFESFIRSLQHEDDFPVEGLAD